MTYHLFGHFEDVKKGKHYSKETTNTINNVNLV